jgi:hypothetical protein
MTSTSFHCCASCVHFEVRKNLINKSLGCESIKPLVDNEIGKLNAKGNITYLCSRLGFETKPKHQFNCWTPKEEVVKLMNKKKC